MPDIDGYIEGFSWTDYKLLVNRDLTSITVTRADGSTVTAQNVRIITFSDRENPWRSDGARTGRTDAIILGYKGHDTYADTDLQYGDRFVIDGHAYDIFEIIPGLDYQFQASAQLRE